MTHMKNSESILWKTLKFFQLHKVYREIKWVLPPSVASVVTDARIKNVHTPLVLVEELEPKYEMGCKYLQGLGSEFGDYLEFGVSAGTSMACMHRVLRKLKLDNVRLIGFDSFEGMPAAAELEDEGTWKAGEFASAIKETKKFLTKEGIDWNRTFLIKGWFEDTCNASTKKQYGIRKASIVMVDCDIYSASKVALNYSLSMIGDHVLIYFDDWKDDINFGEYKAYSEFLAENQHLRSKQIGTYNPTGKIFHVTNGRYKK
jgi:O-methyltransferase